MTKNFQSKDNQKCLDSIEETESKQTMYSYGEVISLIGRKYRVTGAQFKDMILENRFKVDRQLDHGSFGKVYKVIVLNDK